MMVMCGICEQTINHDEEVFVFVLTKFKSLKSEVHWALDPNILWADRLSIAHKECYECEKGYGDEEAS